MTTTDQFPRAEDMPPEPESTGDAGATSYVVAVLIPIVGLILAAIHLHKHRIGPGLALVLTSYLGVLLYGLLVVVLGIIVGANEVSNLEESLKELTTTTDTTPTTQTDPGLDTDGDLVPDDVDSEPFDSAVQ